MSFINWTVSGYDHEFCHCGTTKRSATKFAPVFLNRWSLVRRGRSPDRHRTLSSDNQQQERIIESLHMKYSGWASSLENSPKASASPRYFPWFLLGNLNDSFSSISFPNTMSYLQPPSWGYHPLAEVTALGGNRLTMSGVCSCMTNKLRLDRFAGKPSRKSRKWLVPKNPWMSSIEKELPHALFVALFIGP